MKYHLCCNQVDHCWEVRDSKENVMFSGTLSQSDSYLEEIENVNS